MGLTYSRNRAISRVFREAGYSKKIGSGLRTLFSSYEEYGLRTPSIHSEDEFVNCILPTQQADTLPEDYQIRTILNLFETATRLSSSQISHKLKIPKTTVVRKLSKLVEHDQLIKTGSGKATRYILAE